MDPKDRKKIQFSVPAPPSQLDPRQVEMIRRRRPTPALLFRVSEHSSPEEESSPHQRTSGEGHHPKSKRPNPCGYTPPSLKGTNPTPPSVLWNPGALHVGEEEALSAGKDCHQLCA